MVYDSAQIISETCDHFRVAPMSQTSRGCSMTRATLSREGTIAELAEWYGTDKRIWRQFDQASLDLAWLVAVGRWP